MNTKTKFPRFPLFIFIMLTQFIAACGAIAPEPTATVTLTPQPANTPTATLPPTKTPRPTATPNIAATQQYEDFFAFVQQVYADGQISTVEGKYIKLGDYQEELANKLSYSWDEFSVRAKNFIIQSNFEWSNSVNTTNTSGCGFVYRIQPNEDHYLIFLDAFNGVKLASSTDRGTYSMGSPSNGEKKVDDFGASPYHAKFTLVVNELKTYVYVNDIYYGEYKLLDYRITDSGPLAAAILSATDIDYGTRCKMTNVEAWIISP